MSELPKCPKCGSEYTYEDGHMLVCPECAHEWSIEEEQVEELVVKDANGNILQDGDSVVVVKDIKVKGYANSIKVGTKIKNIRCVEPVNGHNIDVNIKGFGQILLKSELVKKSA